MINGGIFMKTTRLVIGIISMVLFVLIALQSCVAGVGNALEQAGETSGSSGLFLAVFMLIAGIVGVAARKSKGGKAESRHRACERKDKSGGREHQKPRIT